MQNFVGYKFNTIKTFREMMPIEQVLEKIFSPRMEKMFEMSM